jgi:hypothetical protein
MPRCGCADACSCLIVAGDGISVEGIGTLERPYEITSESADLTGRIIFTDDGNIDFTTTGVGTLNDPTVVSADANLTLGDLTDVPDEAPVEGDVLVWRIDHWEYEQQAGGGASLPPGGTDGQVLTKQSAVDGDADWETLPAATAPSGVWGVAPLNIYGADSLFGRETYVDSAGQLRVKPLVFDRASSSIVATSLPSAYPRGVSVMRVVAAENGAGSGWPDNGTYGFVETQVSVDRTAAVQIWRRDTSVPGLGVTWQRNYATGAWWPWLETSARKDYCSLSANAVQTMASATEVVMTYAAAASDDPLGMWDGSGTVTAKRDGLYEIILGYSYGANATGSRIALCRINTTTVRSWTIGGAGVASTLTGTISIIRQLTINDTIQMRQYQASGGNLPTHNQAYPSLQVIRLGDKVT